MAHGHAHEEAEHASHHASDPFDKRVAMTMVVVAAVLAMVKVQGHRTHNDVLVYQIKAGAAHTRESDLHTRESDQWNFYQAKKMRQHMYDSQSEWADLVLSEKKKKEPAIKKKLASLKKQASRYKKETEKIKEDAEKLKEDADKEQKTAHKYQEKSEHKHHQANYFDLGELGVELAIVLCSVAILTKQRGFWYSGMGIGVVGLIVVAMGFFAH
jgi:hypothetical protein